MADTVSFNVLGASPTCHFDESNIKKMSTDDWWNDDTDGRRKYWEKNLSHCHFLHHKSHMD
jgi:hypothetical protein